MVEDVVEPFDGAAPSPQLDTVKDSVKASPLSPLNHRDTGGDGVVNRNSCSGLLCCWESPRRGSINKFNTAFIRRRNLVSCSFFLFSRSFIASHRHMIRSSSRGGEFGLTLREGPARAELAAMDMQDKLERDGVSRDW